MLIPQKNTWYCKKTKNIFLKLLCPRCLMEKYFCRCCRLKVHYES